VVAVGGGRDRELQGQACRGIFKGRHPGKGFPADLIRAARRKLIMLAEARALEDLRSPPSNHLEALRGDRTGQHSSRINDQWVLSNVQIFVWTGRDAENVEIVDYH
jgi:proteic killer suppression protein